MTKYKLYVNADSNDGDYIGRLSDIEEKDIPLIEKVAKVLKEAKRYNWSEADEGVEEIAKKYEGKLTEQELDIFNDYVAYCEYRPHTIETVEILEITKVRRLL